MAMALLSAAMGAYVHLYTTIWSGGLLSSLGVLGFGFALFSSHDDPKTRSTRMGYLMALALCSGLSMGPLLDMALFINPSIIPTAFLSTCVIFGCFTLSTMFADHRKYMYLGGTLMSMLSVLMMLSLVNLFIGSKFLFDIYIYLFLFTVCGFICYDTALIIEKNRMGEEDYIQHSLLLFIDFIDLFRILVVILTQREAEKDRKKRR